MTKKGQQEKIAKVVSRGRRTQVMAMGLPETVAPEVQERKWSKEKFMPFGRHNLFPEFCRALADNCAPLNTCVNTMALYIAGNGLEFLDINGDPVKRAHDLWHNRWLKLTSEEEFGHAVGLDIALLEAFSVTPIRSKRGIEDLHHLDVSRLRMGKKVEDVVKEFYWSSNWERFGKGEKDYAPKDIPTWTGTEDRGVIYRGGYKQTRDYYGEPWWLPAIADAEVLTRIPLFNRTQLDTGFRPAFHIHVFDNSDKVDLDQLDEDVEAVFTGANGKTYVVTYGTVQEGAPKITKLERGDHAGELDAMDKYTTTKVYKAYGIPPILLGDDVNTGMSGKGLAIEQTLTMFLRTKVAPLQKMYTGMVRKLMLAEGITELAEVRVKQLVPFDAATDPALKRQTYLRKVTVAEDRVKEGLPILTTDGKEPAPDKSNWDKRMDLMLIEVGTQAGMNTNEEQDANKGTNTDE